MSNTVVDDWQLLDIFPSALFFHSPAPLAVKRRLGSQAWAEHQFRTLSLNPDSRTEAHWTFSLLGNPFIASSLACEHGS